MIESSSQRQILRSTSIIGGASLLNIIVSLLRAKVAAVILGPAGVGLIGLLMTLLSTAAAIAGLGFGNVGTRQIAEAAARQEENGMAAVRRALFLGTVGLAVTGGGVFWALRAPLARFVLGDVKLAAEVGWLALAVSLTIGASSQTAVLNGLRKIGDLARISVLTSVVSTLVGAGVLVLWGRAGVIAYVLAAPCAAFVFGHIYVARLPKVRAPATPLSDLFGQWGVLARLGMAFTLAALATLGSQLFVRSLVQNQLGSAAAGDFQASWTISMTYVGFVLGAMGADYYPRLSAAIQDHASVNRMVNEQTELALLLASPVFLAMLGLAPWVIRILYSVQFAEAAVVLRWQILGDVLKIAAWPLGYVILAAGDGKTFLLVECLAASAFMLMTSILISTFRIESTGIAFFVMYLLYFLLVYLLAKRRTGFSWASNVRGRFLSVFGLAVVVMASSAFGSVYSLILGCLATMFLTIDAARQLWRLIDWRSILKGPM